MGVSISRFIELTNNELLARFCSDEPISPNDPFWNQLLAFNISPPKTHEEQLLFDSSTEALMERFLTTNQQTGNLGSLVHVFITRATELLASPSTDNAMLAWQTFNALFVIRSVTKYLVEMVPDYQLELHFDTQLDYRTRNDTKTNIKTNDISKQSQPSDQLETKIIDPSTNNINNQVVTPINKDLSENNSTSQNLSGTNDSLSMTNQNLIDINQSLSETNQNLSEAGQSLSKTRQAVNNNGQKSPVIYKTISNESRVEMLCDALIGLICDVPVTDNTYYLHLECINTLLVLMSVYIFASNHEKDKLMESSFIYRTLYQEGRYGMHAPLLVKTLLQNFYTMKSAPAHMFGCTPEGGSLVINIASGLWNMLTFNTATPKARNIFTHPPLDKAELQQRLCQEHPVANQSVLLLLATHSHWLTHMNLYRIALFNATDIKAEPSTTPSKEGNPPVASPRIDMAELHKAICATASCEHVTLLLYLMLHSCAAYKQHVFQDPHSEALIIPILQCLYDAPQNSSHHIYMALIVLLILTEDSKLIHSIHQINIKNPTWYTERALSEVSLGGLCILVIIRTVQYNIVRVRDKYLHTNCLAALANMSSEFRNLHPYVAQRLVSLFETLTKRRQRLCAEIGGGEGDMNGGVDFARHTDERAEELWEHICVLDEVLRMLLEIVNSCLSSQLQNNLNLVYALLHKRQVFELYTNHPQHAPILNNIEMVIGYFSSRLQRVQDGVGGDLGVNEVLATIKRGAEQWSNDRLKKFPELKFRYVEEERPEEFFTPYTWTLVSNSGSIYWSSENSSKALQYLTQC